MINIKKAAFRAALSTATVLATAAAGLGQEPGVRRVSLDEAVALFAANNLELRLARTRAVEAAALARQAAAFPNPALLGSHEAMSGDDDASYSESYLGVSQRVEWPSLRAARRDAAEAVARATIAQLAVDSARLAAGLKQAYVDAVRTERTADVMEQLAAVFRNASASSRIRYDEGDISLYELRRIALENARYENEGSAATLDAAASRRALALMAAPESEELELAPADALDFPSSALDFGDPTAYALGRRRDVEAAVAAVEAARAVADAARSERFPDVTANAGYKRQSDGLSGALLGLSLPLPLWDRRSGQVGAANARVAAAEAQLALTTRQVEMDVARAVERHRAAAARIALLREATRDAADLLDIARVAYDAGEMDLLALLDAANALREAQLLEARLRAEYWNSYFDLERAVGGFDDTDGSRNDR